MRIARLWSLLATLTVASLPQLAAGPIDPAQGGVIVLVGGGQGERLLRDAAFEAELQRRFSGRDLTIRNLCDDGDTPGYRDHSGRNSPFAFPGAEKFYPLSKAKDFWGSGHAGSGFSQSPDQWLTGLKADVILAWFGYAESFKGKEGVPAFKAELEAWLDHTAQQKYNGKAAPQVVLITPRPLDVATAPQGPAAAAAVNENVALYAQAIRTSRPPANSRSSISTPPARSTSPGRSSTAPLPRVPPPRLTSPRSPSRSTIRTGIGRSSPRCRMASTCSAAATSPSVPIISRPN